MMNLKSVILVFTGLLTEIFAPQVVNVSLKGTAVLPCYGRHRETPVEEQDVTWRIAEGQLVARRSQGQFKEGPGYEGRVQLSEKGTEDGNFSLIVSPVEYNDEGLYDCCIGFKHLAAVTLNVSVSTDRNISAQVGDPVIVPCYANVNKQANVSHLNIRWEKDGQTVLDIQSGSIFTGSGFENRVGVSPDRVRLGNLSLTISMVRLSDRGAYRCFFNSDQETPDGIIPTIAGSMYRVMDNRTNDTINTVFVSVTVPSTVVFTVLMVLLLLLLESLLLLWMTVQEFNKNKKKINLHLLFLALMLLLNLVLMALSVTLTVQPGQKELYVALGVGLGLFLIFNMVIMSMTCEKLVKIRKEKTLWGILKLVLLVLLLVFLVTRMVLPWQTWLDWILFPVLGLFMILDMVIIYISHYSISGK